MKNSQKKRTSISLSPEVMRLLREQDNMSDYIERLIIEDYVANQFGIRAKKRYLKV